MPRSSLRLMLLIACAAAMVAPSQPSRSQEPGSSPSVPGAVVVPDTPAGHQFEAWLTAFNSGDRDAMRAVLDRFADKAAPPPDVIARIRQTTGGFDLMKITSSTDIRLVALLRERGSEKFIVGTTEVDATPEHRILSMLLTPTGTPPEFAVTRLSDPALAGQLEVKLKDLAGKDAFSGAVLVAKGDKAIFSGAYGFADRDARLPNQLDTIFRYGSMGKMFTATAVLQLVQSGKIKLSDPVGKFLPDYPNQDIARKVTIEQLLTHTGGTGDIFTPDWAAHRTELNSHADYVKLFGERAPRFEPGSKWTYSNYGYILLGRIIEVASGEDYYAYLHDHIFVPVGMTSTGFWPESQPLPRRAVGYASTPDGLRSNANQLPDRGMAAGGGLSTVNDMLRFSQALLGNKLLDAQHTALLTTGRVSPGRGADTRYAFGFEDASAGKPEHNIGHNGGAPGMNGSLRIYPEAGYVVVVLSNFDPPAAERVSSFIMNRLSL